MAIININGIIGQDYTYKQFITDYAKCGNEQIRLLIDSPGGDTYEGNLIANYIKDNATRFDSVINSGDVGSIAASIFLALPYEKRYFDLRRGQALIHNPYITDVDGLDTTAAGLKNIAEYVEQDEKEIRTFIVKQTGADVNVIKAFMDINEPLNEEQLKSINFAQIIKQEFKAVAYFKNKNDMTDLKEINEKLNEQKTLLDKVIALFKPKTVALMLTDANGETIEFPELQEGTMPQVGDKTTAPDGEVVMADGYTYVISGGVLTEIKEPEQTDVTVELEALKAENEQLKAQIAGMEEIKAQVVNLNKEVVALQGKVKSQMIDDVPAEKEKEPQTKKFVFNGTKK